MNDDDLKQLWKSQPTEQLTMSAQEIHLLAEKLQRRVRVRNALEYAAGVIVVIGFAGYIERFSGPLIRTGSVLIILATAFVLYQLHRRGASRTPPAKEFGAASLSFYRAELARQRDAVRDAWLWYIAPFAPGVIVFRWGVETELANSPLFVHGALSNGVIAAVFIAIALFNRWSARRLQRRLDKLDALVIEGDMPLPNKQQPK